MKKDSLEKNRALALRGFSNKYIDFVYVYFDDINNSSKVSKIDYFWVGSDQVWNPEGWLNETLAFLLFCPKQKRLSYASSFGVDEIPEDKKEIFAGYLNNFAFISVRENSGQAIVKELTGKNVDIFLDPTLMLTKEKWLKIEQSVRINKPYILLYFLDNMNEEIHKNIKMFAKEQRWEIIELQNKKEKRWYSINPRIFLYLIHHAKMILTDSFHGTVFSLLFHKTFYSFRATGMRAAMFDRIQTLLEAVELEERIYNENAFHYFDTISAEKYSKVDRILDEKREAILNKIKDLKI